jgi:hypothetical protein
MRFTLILWALCPLISFAQRPGRCSFPIDSLSPTLVLRSLAGVYDLEWISSSDAIRRQRLWLWRTLPNDRSINRPSLRPSSNDSLRFPLWGNLTSVTIPLAQQDSLRRTTDPLDPPVLLMSPWRPGDPPALLVGTEATRRPNVLALDGAGIGLWLSHADGGGLGGHYSPYGIVVTDSGYACARRIQ